MLRQNFRAAYLHQLGFSQLESQLQENHIDLAKVRKMALKNGIPPKHRCLIWKLLLGIVPIHKESWEYVQEQRKQQFQDMEQASKSILKGMEGRGYSFKGELLNVDPGTKIQKGIEEEVNSEVILLIHLSQREYFTSFQEEMHEKVEVDMDEIRKICKIICGFCKSKLDAFWCFSHFLNPNSTFSTQKNVIVRQINIVLRLLELQQSELLTHLHNHNVAVELFCYRWFRSHFVCTNLPTECLIRIWDRRVGLSPDYYACVAYIILYILKCRIMQQPNAESIKKLLFNLTDMSVDSVNKAVDIFLAMN